MKYLFFYFILCFFTIQTVNGQEFNAGFIAGLSTSEISGDFVTGPSKAGLYLGLFTNLYVSKKSSLQLEFNYVQKGSRENPDSVNLRSYILRLHYAEVHCYYKYDIEKFTLEAGPSLGYLMHSYEEADGWILEQPFNPLDFSLNIGLYYRISEKLQFNVRYSNTIIFPVRDSPYGDTYFLRKGQYNEVLSFTFHYTFRNIKK